MNLHVERWRHAVAALQSDVTVQEREFDQVPRAQNYDVILAFSSIHKPKQFRIQLFQKKQPLQSRTPHTNLTVLPSISLMYAFWSIPSGQLLVSMGRVL